MVIKKISVTAGIRKDRDGINEGIYLPPGGGYFCFGKIIKEMKT